MLLFKDYHVPLILNHRKIETRRIIKPVMKGGIAVPQADPKPRWKVGAKHWASTRLYDKAAYFARLEILAVRPDRLGDIGDDGVTSEGYLTLMGFVKSWKEINGEWNGDARVWVVRFHCIGDARGFFE